MGIGIRTISLVRERQSDQGTFGRLIIDPLTTLKTGELPFRDINKDGWTDTEYSRIPAGVYRCQFTTSLKFPLGSFQLLHVESDRRTGVRIHKGNWCGDKKLGFCSDIEGCILLGTVIEPRLCLKNGNKVQWGIFNSTQAYDKFMDKMGKNQFDLEIFEEFI
jgi:hypothetical protein